MSSIKTDFHIHTSLSTDGLSSMEAMVEHGIRLGLTHLCFTEHMDYDNTYDKNPDGTDAFMVNMNDYLKRFRICKKRYELL
jgi:histidinol-phosphatase (PHP family)